jgi:hypothetical protein
MRHTDPALVRSSNRGVEFAEPRQPVRELLATPFPGPVALRSIIRLNVPLKLPGPGLSINWNCVQTSENRAPSESLRFQQS